MPDESTQLLPGRPGLVGPVLAPGALLLHTYQVERMLAHGGMGEVYLVRHCELGTRHAIKVIRPHLIGPGVIGTEAALDLAELFRREALALSSIRHDAVVGYEGFFRDGQRTSYLVMEYVAGPSLSAVLQSRPLTPDEVYRLRDRVADGLAAAHARGVIHRDLAPDNIILPGGEIDRAKVIDFGISKRADNAGTTIIGNTFAGKLRFAAPEQLGLAGAQVGPTADIYSLALVLAAAAGTPLAMGDTIAGAVQARMGLPDLKGVPAWLRPQLAAMLAPEPGDRPASMAEVLRRWPRPAVAGPRSLDGSRGRWPRRGVAVGLSVVAVLTLVLGLGLVLIGPVDRAVGPADGPRVSADQDAPAPVVEPPPAPPVAVPAQPPPGPAPALTSAPPAAQPPAEVAGAGPGRPAPTPPGQSDPTGPETPGGAVAVARPPADPEPAAAQPGRSVAVSKDDRVAGPDLARPRASGPAATAHCHNLLLRAQLGEPLSGGDRAALAACR